MKERLIIIQINEWLNEIKEGDLDKQKKILLKMMNFLKLPEKKEIIQNITWNIIPELYSYFNINETLPAIQLILKTCIEIGNAKEMFLRLMEMLYWIINNINQNDKYEKKQIIIIQIKILYECFEIVISKINTKYPSKFIIDYSLAFISAISIIFNKYNIHSEELYTIIINFAKQRVAQFDKLFNNNEEKNIQKNILHCFITQIFESFFEKKNNYWSIRYYTLLNPYKMKFRKINYDNQFDNIICSLKNIALDTGFDFTILWRLGKTLKNTDNPKNHLLKLSISSSDIFISSYGSIFLLGAYIFENPSVVLDNTISKFLDHMEMVISFSKYKSITPSLIDVNLFIGLSILNELQDISMIDQKYFLEYIKILSLISSSLEDSTLRFLTYILIYQSLIRHSENTVIIYIKNTLDTSPLENLKTIVISILKDEIQRHWNDSSSSFISSIYDSLLIKIFRPNPPTIFNSIEIFLKNFNFIMQGLNLYLFLLKKPGDDKIGIKSSTNILKTKKSWIDPLMNFTIFWITQLTQLESSNYLKENTNNSKILRKLFLLKYTLDKIQEQNI
ncbi:hypothetical protein PCK1_001921 [Pneumocystis canis]|nr:hypothetical protein PCK1_001921 [Pneumocystis canis]